MAEFAQLLLKYRERGNSNKTHLAWDLNVSRHYVHVHSLFNKIYIG